MKSLSNPNYNDEEREKIVSYFCALTVEQIQTCLRELKLKPISGTKGELKTRIEDWLADRKLTYEQMVGFLDTLAPWGKQHIYLYKGPSRSIADWKKTDWVKNHLTENGVGHLFNAHLPLILPSSLKFSSIQHSSQKLRITAVEKREEWKRDENRDHQEKNEAGDDVVFRAFIHIVTRGLISFEWDLLSNTAFLQVSQLPTRQKYEEARDRFAQLLTPWIDFDQFTLLDICPAIKELERLSKDSNPEIKSHRCDWLTIQNSKISVSSASAQNSIHEDTMADHAQDEVRQRGLARFGNFYWLREKLSNSSGEPSTKDVHTNLVGSHSRINFPTPNSEEVVRYVISRVRAFSK